MEASADPLSLANPLPLTVTVPGTVTFPSAASLIVVRAPPWSTPATVIAPVALIVAVPRTVSTPPAATLSNSIQVTVVVPATPTVHAPVTLIAWRTDEVHMHMAHGAGAALPAGHTCVPKVQGMAVGLWEPAGQ